MNEAIRCTFIGSQSTAMWYIFFQVNLAVGGHINDEIYLTGLSPRELILSFRHRTLILFKLMMLERRNRINMLTYSCFVLFW